MASADVSGASTFLSPILNWGMRFQSLSFLPRRTLLQCSRNGQAAGINTKESRAAQYFDEKIWRQLPMHYCEVIISSVVPL